MKHKANVPLFRDHEEATIAGFRKDPQRAAEYLNSVLEEGGRGGAGTVLIAQDSWIGRRSSC